MDRTSAQPKSSEKKVPQGGPSTSEAPFAQAAGQEISLEPTEAEVESWAERVRRRRQAWVDGPTEEEKQDWLRRERARRLAQLEFEAETRPGNGGATTFDSYEERRRLQRHYIRDMRLATEGLGIWMATWPFRALAELVATGREWEEESLRPARRRWIPFYDDEL
jgi:hypothetical protein